ncbi:hypothetical protein N7539_003950 [Penicillium diatomitis]|uniref:SRR1-like domain-containing protein n=1 Tax=Penicillium diatomitis TaxID=2819901 RepID=A0A9W9XCW2_9EURO|nr:uncharacterized protein N7539_003950 [Penicillium diatomitis]KAJ5489060.1 hypothetical protein N7539_003950 [Penicillium diatomitis]
MKDSPNMAEDQQKYRHNQSNLNISNQFFGARYRWSTVPQDAPQSTEEAQALIDQLYLSGGPFFSKEMIRLAFEQCQRKPVRGEMLYINDVTGAVVEFECQTGEVKIQIDHDGEKSTYLLLDPVLSYECRAHLKHHLWWTGIREDRSPFCSLTLLHPSFKFKTDTREPIDPTPRRPPEAVAQEFLDRSRKWQKSEVAQQLVHILCAHAAGHEISKIIGLALGAISYDTDDRSRSFVQHALLLTLQDWLMGRDKKDKPVCYAQDPAYRSVDRQILKEHGIEAIDDPRAWLEIDNESIVFSVAPNVPVKEIVADIARPAIVIWERVGYNDADREGKMSCTDPDSPRVRAMLAQYEVFDFGAEDDPDFCKTVIYIRRCSS